MKPIWRTRGQRIASLAGERKGPLGKGLPVLAVVSLLVGAVAISLLLRGLGTVAFGNSGDVIGAAHSLAINRNPLVERYFPIGVFEDAAMVGGSTTNFEAMITDLRSRGFDSVFFTRNFVARDAPLLDVSDRLGFNVFFAPDDLDETWWSTKVQGNEETAARAIRLVVDQLSQHPSLKGYSIFDEPELRFRDKLLIATDVFEKLDPARPAMPTLVGLDRASPLFAAIQPSVMLLDVYPVGYDNPLGDFTMTGFGYSNIDFVKYVRKIAKHKPPTTPLWVILQTHSYEHTLREPAPAEVRAENWLAIGEGATGIFWFIYSSQQGWRGLVDNPALYEEVTTLARRVKGLRNVLISLNKADDKFVVAGAKDPYVSTLANAEGNKFYAVAVNRDFLRPQMLTIKSPVLTGQLRDLETSQIYAMGAPIEFQPGDGKVFELIDGGAPTSEIPAYPVDYDADVQTWWAGHPFNPESPTYIPIGGIASPSPTIKVRAQYGGDIQAAINALPPTGGTLYLEPGRYNNNWQLVGKSNVHFVSDGGAILYGGPSNVDGCELALDYSAFSLAVNKRDQNALACATTDRIGDIYFKNLTFDGSGSAYYALALSAAKGIVFDNVTFQNYFDPGDSHRGLVSGSGMVDNVWFRGSHFVGNERYALYLDGTHGSGVVDSQIDYNFGSGGLLFLTNDDFSDDYNGNGTWDPDEVRLSNYVVVARNTFGPGGAEGGIPTAIQATAANVLIKGNTTYRYAQNLAQFDKRCSQRWPGLSYLYYGSRVISNRLEDATNLVTFNGNVASCNDKMGKYEVRDNVVSNGAHLERAVNELGKIDGPNVVTNNWRAMPNNAQVAR